MKQEWINVKYKLPDLQESEDLAETKVSVKVLVFDKYGEMFVARYEQWEDSDEGCWYTVDSEHWSLESDRVTHWRYLPSKPIITSNK